MSEDTRKCRQARLRDMRQPVGNAHGASIESEIEELSCFGESKREFAAVFEGGGAHGATPAGSCGPTPTPTPVGPGRPLYININRAAVLILSWVSVA